MKIAVFDHVGNWGGGSRFCRALLLSLKKQFPGIVITYFGSKASISRDNLREEFNVAGISVNYLNSLDVNKYYKKLSYLLHTKANKIVKHLQLRSLFRSGIHKEIERYSKGYDVAFFPWPYFLECPILDCPMVGVFHDFNYKYLFGTPIFSEPQYCELNSQMTGWLEHAKPVVSSYFTASELAKFYPSIVSKVEIVHLAPFSISKMLKTEALKIVNDLGISRPYILYPANICQHKNMGILFRAIYLVRQQGIKATLVVTGLGTECATGKASAYGLERNTETADVIGLGYVSNHQIDALIQSADAVISTSLYEAGNGPGLDAWSHGTPVIMSDIPSFSEHLNVLGVKAWLIDPYNANDIAEKIQFVLENYDRAKDAAMQSLENLRVHTWEKVATRYYEIFSSVMKK